MDGSILFGIGRGVVWSTSRLISTGYESLRVAANRGPIPEWANVDPGLTCHIEGRLVLHWPDGKQTETPFQVLDSNPYEITTDSPVFEVSTYLGSIIEETAENLVQEVADEASQDESGSASV